MGSLDERIRSWRFAKQGLDGSAVGWDTCAILSKSGWARSVGGAGPYIGLYTRGRLSRDRVDQDVAATRIHELPSARGCTYVLPSADFALGLLAGQGFSDEAEITIAKKYLGVTDDELAALSAAVLNALEPGVLDPAGLKGVVGDLVRSLGEDGKKRGITTTLPLVLGRLQSSGKIRRVPVNGRLDQQRYAYTLWNPGPLEQDPIARSDVFPQLASMFFRWIGPAKLDSFQFFSALGVKATKEAVANLALVPIEPGDDRLILADEVDAFWKHSLPERPHFALVSSLDPFLLLPRDLGSLMNEEDRGFMVRTEKTFTQIGGLSELNDHAILDRGRLIGLWVYDPDESEIAWTTFGPIPSELSEAVDDMQRFVRDQLGDLRSFSLDSPQSRKPKIEAIRQSARSVATSG